MIRRTHIVTVVVCAVILLTLGVGWFALGQMESTPSTPAPELSPGMEVPLVKDMPLTDQVANLAQRVTVLETTITRLENEINDLKAKSNKK